MEPAKFGALALIGILIFVFFINPLVGIIVSVVAFPMWLLLGRMLLDRDTNWHVPEQDWYNSGGHGKV